MKAVLFDIDNTLYDSTMQAQAARRNAVDAMIDAGLPGPRERGLSVLNKIVEEYGSNYEGHFNVLVKRLGMSKDTTRVVAAGIVAYHNTKVSMLHPFPDTVPTLLSLRDKGFRLGVVTDGTPVKQWEKLIRLGLQHFFHTVVITDEVGMKKPSVELYKLAARRIGCDTKDCVMVGDRLDSDISGAKRAGMVTVRILQGKYKKQKPTSANRPDFSIKNISGLLKVIGTLK